MPDEPTTEDLEDAILAAAVEGVAEVTVDGANVRDHRLKDRLEVLDRKNNDVAAANSNFGMRNVRLISPAGGF